MVVWSTPRILRRLQNTKFFSREFFKGWKFFVDRLTFRNKILATIIAGMTFSTLITGIITVIYITDQYNNDELSRLSKKTRLINIELENKLKEIEPQTTIQENLGSIIKSLSDIYQTDINVFNVQGDLLASTQNVIYDRKVLSPKVHPLAYIKFYTQYASQIIQEENIGKLHYTASYMPIRNSSGEIAGFLNLPYFSKEKELTDRISSFLVSLINLYILLFILLLFAGIVLSRWLTSPLNIIRRYLRNTSLSGNYEPIEWPSNDELGKLVKEYNQMVIALQESAEELKNSARENSWRDMAKQVAHEIKNPLTPMKLNLQMLRRAYEENSPEADIMFERVTNLLISQIESLSQIASAFSEYAEMPPGKPEVVDVNLQLRNAAVLFSQQTEAKINLDLWPTALNVFIDPSFMVRVLNNLVKNALQAIPASREGMITIRSFIQDEMAVISVEDNGIGISEEFRSKIFVPNFSTKSSGKGLGLAITRKIIENVGGRVAYESEEGKGTTFLIYLPIVAES
jgi:signal transduction histidine kinase